MPRSSGRRGQVEPVPALVAVAVLGFALAAYAGVVAEAVPAGRDRNPARPALRGALADLRPGGVVLPGRLDRALAAAPRGHRLNASLTAGRRAWHAGPDPPAGADAATRVVAVRVGPGSVQPGRLRVVVWP